VWLAAGRDAGQPYSRDAVGSGSYLAFLARSTKGDRRSEMTDHSILTGRGVETTPADLELTALDGSCVLYELERVAR
jgi:hypothetical protein